MTDYETAADAPEAARGGAERDAETKRDGAWVRAPQEAARAGRAEANSDGPAEATRTAASIKHGKCFVLVIVRTVRPAFFRVCVALPLQRFTVHDRFWQF